MSTLQIIKLESGTFKHVDSIDGEFFLGRFNFKQELTKAFLVEAYGAKRREYVIEDVSVYDYLGAEETFTNFTDLENRLTELGYTGIETNGIIPTASSYISSDVDNAIVLGTDSKLFVPKTTGGIESVVAGTNVTIDDTDPLNPIISASGGGTVKREQIINWYGRPDLSAVGSWVSNFGSYFRYWTENFAFASWGSGTVPDGNIYNNGVAHLIIPNSKLIEARLLIDGSANNVASELDLWIGTGQKGAGSPYPGVDINLQELVKQTVVLPTGGGSIRLIVPLTILTHSTLVENKMYIAVRSRVNGNQYGLQLQAIFKEQ